MRNSHTQTIDNCLHELDTSPQGLSNQEAKSRLERYGKNTIPEEKPSSVINIFAHQFMSPLIYILLFSGFITLYFKEYSGAIFIFAVLLVNAIIGCAQEYSANNAAAALKKMVSSQIRVRREETLLEIDATELVIGDIVLLETGNKVPADGRLLESSELKVDESLLTGESEEALKDPLATLDDNTPTGDQVNMVFAGSMVTHGRGICVIVATSLETKIGEIARGVKQNADTKSPLIIRMEKLTRQISLMVGLIVAVMATVLYFQGHDFEYIFILSISIAVAAIPEGLPVTLTIALAMGMRRMAKCNVIVRKLVAVESLGSCTLIASDKTGTLTRNELTTERIVLPSGNIFFIQGEHILSDLESLKKEGQYSSTRDNDIEKKDDFVNLINSAILANEGSLIQSGSNWQAKGDAVDCSLLFMAKKAGYSKGAVAKQYQQIFFIHYESQSKFSACISKKQGKTYAFVKGAVETLVQLCSRQAMGDTTSTLDIDLLSSQEKMLSKQQYRVLAFAFGEVEEKSSYTKDNLKNLTFLGMTGMGDPLRTEAKPAIDACKQAGIKVVMITGDHPQTAFAIAQELSLSENENEVVTGQQFYQAQKNSKQAVDALTRNSTVYARVEPGQKLDIVDSLIRDGHFVAVTGDGVNDAPALKHAHVGVAMGLKGTDVARESADIIIADDNFASIVSGIEEGRTAYANIRKIVFFLIATSLAEVCMFLSAVALGLPIPLFATQLLWLNFVTSIIQDIALALDPPEGSELNRPPRNPKDSIFDSIMKTRILITALTMGCISFSEFYWMLHVGGYSIEDARNLLLLQFVLFETVIVINSQSETQSIFSQPFMKNPLLIYGALAAQLLHIAAMHIPILKEALHIHPVNFKEWAVLVFIAFIPMLVIEIEKWVQRTKVKKPVKILG